MEGILLARDGREIARARIATPRQGYQPVLDAVAALVGELESRGGASPGTPTVGIATPGFLAPADGRVRNSNLAALNGQPLDRDLAARLGRSVRLENDANCFVLSEAVDGAAAPTPGATGDGARPLDVVFGATLGTGIGGGLVLGGRVWGGANGSAAEWSHTTLPFWRDEDGSGAPCFCGHPRCIESFLSGGGIAWDHQRHTGEELAAPAVAERE